MKLLQKNKIKNNLNTEHTGMGVFSAVAGNQLPNPLQKRVLPALFHLRCPSHTSDDSYIYQLSLVLATAAVSYLQFVKRLFFIIAESYEHYEMLITAVVDIVIPGYDLSLIHI